jgi:magnesium transporter
VLLHVELPEEEGLARQEPARLLGLDAKERDWFRRPGESARAEFPGDVAGCVVPVVHDEELRLLEEPGHPLRSQPDKPAVPVRGERQR